MDLLNISSVASESSTDDIPSSLPFNTINHRQLASPTPVAEVTEISNLRHALNEKNLQLIENRVTTERTLQDMTSNMQKQLVELASAKSELRRYKRSRPLQNLDRDNKQHHHHHQKQPPHTYNSFDTSSIASTSSTTFSTSSSLPHYESARTQWPNERELHSLQKKYRDLQSNHRAIEATMNKQNLQQMAHQDQCELLQARALSAEEARDKMKHTVLRLQKQSQTLGNDLQSRVSLVESKSIQYRRRLQDAETRDQHQEDEIRQLQNELKLVSAREDILKRRVKDSLFANEKGREAVTEVDRLRRRVNELNIKLEKKEIVMEQQAKRAQTAVEFQNALVACKSRLNQREEQIGTLRAQVKESRTNMRNMNDKCATSNENVAVSQAKARASERIIVDVRLKLQQSREENETLRHHHAGQQEHIHQLQADLRSVSSLGMEEATLFASGGPTSRRNTSKTTEEKVNISLQRKLNQAEKELIEMKNLIDGAVSSTVSSTTTGSKNMNSTTLLSNGNDSTLTVVELSDGPGDDGLLRVLLLDVEILVAEVVSMSSLLMKVMKGQNDLIGPDDLLIDNELYIERENREKKNGNIAAMPSVAKLCTKIVNVRKEVRIVRQNLADKLTDSLDDGVGCGMQ